jgi:uncharacterized membrane protein
VLAAVALALLASGAFIYFVHHISVTIQASEMARAITRTATTEIVAEVDAVRALLSTDNRQAPARRAPVPPG